MKPTFSASALLFLLALTQACVTSEAPKRLGESRVEFAVNAHTRMQAGDKVAVLRSQCETKHYTRARACWTERLSNGRVAERNDDHVVVIVDEKIESLDKAYVKKAGMTDAK